MGSYRLTDEAEADLIRIHQSPVGACVTMARNKQIGILPRFLTASNSWPNNRSCTRSPISKGFRRSACVAQTACTTASTMAVGTMAIIGRQDAEQWL